MEDICFIDVNSEETFASDYEETEVKPLFEVKVEATRDTDEEKNFISDYEDGEVKPLFEIKVESTRDSDEENDQEEKEYVVYSENGYINNNNDSEHGKQPDVISIKQEVGNDGKRDENYSNDYMRQQQLKEYESILNYYCNSEVDNRTHDDNVEVYMCAICNKRFSWKCTLKKHMIKHWGQEKYTCEVCKKVFNRLDSLNLHVNSQHLGIDGAKCEICGKSYSRRDVLKLHMNTHTNAFIFECDICHKTFNRKDNLRLHRNKHTGQKRYDCVICGKSFIWRASWKIHMNNHAKKQKFSCCVCSEKFSDKVSLDDHQVTVHKDVQMYECEKCGKLFSIKNSWQKHLRRHVREEKALSIVKNEPNLLVPEVELDHVTLVDPNIFQSSKNSLVRKIEEGTTACQDSYNGQC